MRLRFTVSVGMENTRGSYAHQRKKDRREGEEQSKSLGSPFSAFADGKVSNESYHTITDSLMHLG